jgi:hypothetical protein
MKKFQASVSLIIIVSLLGLSSCVTQNHRVEWRTPEIETPISASPYYLTPQNELVGPEEYRIVDHFSFTREAVGKVEGTTESEISYILPANSESRWTIGFEGDLVEPLTSD